MNRRRTSRLRAGQLAFRAALSLGVLALLAIATITGWPDQALSPQAQALLTPPTEPADADNGAVLLEGLLAPTGSDPLAFGSARIERLRQHFSNPRTRDMPYFPADLPADALQPASLTPAARQLCDPLDSACIDSWFAQSIDIELWSDRDAELFTRLDRMMALPRFQMPTIPSALAPPPDFSLLDAILRLRLAAATVTLQQQKNADEACALLARQVLFLRRLLAETPTSLAQKQLASSQLRVHYLTLGEWAARWPKMLAAQTVVLTPLLQDLSPAELDLRPAMQTDTREVAYGIDALDLAPLALSPRLELASSVTAFALFKRNTTLNALAAYLDTLDAALAAPLDERARQAHAARQAFLAGPARANAPGQWLYNPVGRLLLSVTATSPRPYLDRLIDTQAAVRMVMLQHELAATETDDDAAIAARIKAHPLAMLSDNRVIRFDAPTHRLVWSLASARAAGANPPTYDIQLVR